VKLLKSESTYFAWMRGHDGWCDASAHEMRVYGPALYPCYGYFSDVFDDYRRRNEPRYLYLADVEMMLADMHKIGTWRPRGDRT